MGLYPFIMRELLYPRVSLPKKYISYFSFLCVKAGLHTIITSKILNKKEEKYEHEVLKWTIDLKVYLILVIFLLFAGHIVGHR